MNKTFKSFNKEGLNPPVYNPLTDLTEGVAAGRVGGVDEGLQADLTHEVLVHLLAIVVDVGLVVRMVLPTIP